MQPRRKRSERSSKRPACSSAMKSWSRFREVLTVLTILTVLVVFVRIIRYAVLNMAIVLIAALAYIICDNYKKEIEQHRHIFVGGCYHG